MAQAVIRARTDLDASGFQKGISAMQASATRLKGFVAGAFSLGAVAAFANASIQYATKFQDFADQVGVTASEAEGFSRALVNVGGSAEKALGILNKLYEAQQNIADEETAAAFLRFGLSADSVRAKSLPQLLEALGQGIDKVGALGAAQELVGNKSAPVFIAALRQGAAELSKFNNESVNMAVANLDSQTEKVTGFWSKIKMGTAQYLSNWAQGYRAIISGGGAWMEREWQAFKEGTNIRDSKTWFHDTSGMEIFLKGMKELYDEDAKAFEETQKIKYRIERENARAMYVASVLDRKADAKYRERMGFGPGLYEQESDYSERNIPKGFIGPMPQKEKPQEAVDIERFDQLRRIGANIIGGKSVNDLRNIYKILQEARDYEKETADNTERMADNYGTFGR